MNMEYGEQKRNETKERLEIKVGKDTIPSDKHPENNEDAVLDVEDAFAVFDGVGGHKGGHEASRLARQVVKEELAKIPPGLSAKEMVETLKKVLEEANKKVLEEARGELEGMATTASLVKFAEGNCAVVANLGDSRVYLLRGVNGKLEQVTLDDNRAFLMAENEQEARALQSKFNNLTDPSTLSESEQHFFENRNVIIQALGGSTIRPRTYIVDLQPGDKLLLSSDGVHDNLTDLEIEKILGQAASSETLARALSSAAQEVARGGKGRNHRSKMDDISAVVVEVGQRAEVVEENIPRTEAFGEDMDDVEQEALKRQVLTASSLEDLMAVLDRCTVIPLSDGNTLPVLKIQERIREVVAGNLAPNYVPRYGGLRDRAIALRDEKALQEVNNRLFENRISLAKSIDDVMEALTSVPSITTSGGDVIPSEELRNMARRVYEEGVASNFLPRYGGLRDKVVALSKERNTP